MDRQTVDKFLESSSRNAIILNLYLKNSITLEVATEHFGERLKLPLRNVLIYLSKKGNKKAKSLLDSYPHKKQYKNHIELIKTLAEGDFLVKEVAELHGIPLDTVNKYIRALKDEFKCETIHGLFLKLMSQGLIEFKDIKI